MQQVATERAKLLLDLHGKDALSQVLRVARNNQHRPSEFSFLSSVAAEIARSRIMGSEVHAPA
jgi:hypothetical protein